ncbi:MAG: S46 family peptidase, partial [Bacteroidetes bacterium QS_8_68_15]
MRFRALRPLALFLAGVMLAATGCVGSGETAIVTERPEDMPSTEDDPAPDVSERQSGEAAAPADTVSVRRFDQGRMWTFEDPPLDYFEQEYGFRPSDQWLRRARLGALRFADYCSASFVSPRGLILTNHHCARESVSDVSVEGEDLVEDGFYAEERAGERKVKDLYVEQIVEVRNVTDSVETLVKSAAQSNEIEAVAQARRRQSAQLEERLTRQAKRQDTTLRVRVVPLYEGARYSAYTLKRYHDVRLVMAPERDLGFYGGTVDNFTYPRYTLDAAFFRAYTPEGEPVEDNVYFPFSRGGAQEGDPVFTVGNPGTTNRLSTTAQLAYERDVALPQRLETLRSRTRALEQFIEENPAAAEEYDLENTLFSLENALKATRGELEGLRDPALLARRQAGEETLADSIAATDSLQKKYGNTLREIERIQSAKRSSVRQMAAFTGFLNPRLGSHLLARALYAYYHDTVRRRPDVPPDELKRLRKQALEIEEWPAALEKRYIAARLRQVRRTLGPSAPVVRRALRGDSPEAVAQRLAQESALTDSIRFARLLDEGYLKSDDPSVPVIEPLASLFLELNRQQRDFALSEEALGARLNRARLAVYDRARLPPDATFSLRLSDGRVDGYEYNGT